MNKQLHNYLSTTELNIIHKLYGFPEPANEQMVNLIDMYHNMFIILGFILYFIGFMMVVSLDLFNSKSNHYPMYFKKWQESIIDACIVGLPLIIIIYLTIPTIGYIIQMDRLIQYTNSNISIEIVGHQWYWSYYLDCIQNSFLFDFICVAGVQNTIDQIAPFSTEITIDMLLNDAIYQFSFDQFMDIDATGPYRYLAVTKMLVLPVHEYIRCLITSDDVIHSFALPQLGIKVDAIPGRTQAFMLNANKAGIYYGQCSELCGVNHAFMPIAVEFVREDQFYDWYIKNLDIRPYKIFFLLLGKRN